MRQTALLARNDDVYDIEPKRNEMDNQKKGRGFPNPLKLFKPKEKPKSDMEKLIDDQFKGTGPLGSLLGAGVKSIFNIAERGMQDAMKDVEEVKREVNRVLRADR